MKINHTCLPWPAVYMLGGVADGLLGVAFDSILAGVDHSTPVDDG